MPQSFWKFSKSCYSECKITHDVCRLAKGCMGVCNECDYQLEMCEDKCEYSSVYRYS